MSPSLFDIVIFGIIAVSALAGAYSGILRLSIGLVGFFASIFGAYFLYPLALEIVRQYIANKIVADVCSGVLSYIISLIFVHFTIGRLHKITEESSGGLFDRLCGLIAGLLRGVIISILLFLGVAVFTTGSYIEAAKVKDVLATKEEKYPLWLKTSSITSYLDKLLMFSIGFVPERFLDIAVKDKVQENIINQDQKKDHTTDEELKDEIEEILKK